MPFKKVHDKKKCKNCKKKPKSYLSFTEFAKKLKLKKQNIVSYPEKLEPKYISIKDLFKKKK
tara:strand:- start:17704 stop:17889 length:186 start_codon:yes stop_codon:yes gene_type:complete